MIRSAQWRAKPVALAVWAACANACWAQSPDDATVAFRTLMARNLERAYSNAAAHSGALAVQDTGVRGAGVRINVIDTGVRASHADFSGGKVITSASRDLTPGCIGRNQSFASAIDEAVLLVLGRSSDSVAEFRDFLPIERDHELSLAIDNATFLRFRNNRQAFLIETHFPIPFQWHNDFSSAIDCAVFLGFFNLGRPLLIKYCCIIPNQRGHDHAISVDESALAVVTNEGKSAGIEVVPFDSY